MVQRRHLMRIKRVKRISLESAQAVYDITVPKYHNFLLDAGVFVHNCCAMVYSCFTNPVQTNIIDVANAINKQMQSSITSQAKPMYYNLPKRPMNEYDAMKKALALFNGQK